MAQIFVKVNGSKATPMEVNLTDGKVENVMSQIQKDEDVYVTLNGKVLRERREVEELRSYWRMHDSSHEQAAWWRKAQG